MAAEGGEGWLGLAGGSPQALRRGTAGPTHRIKTATRPSIKRIGKLERTCKNKVV